MDALVTSGFTDPFRQYGFLITYNDMNIERIRQDTPGCHDKLFVDTAGASLVPRQVVDAVQEYLALEADLGGYRTAEAREEVIRAFYTEAAKLLSCQSHNIAFVSNATDGYAKALSSVQFQKGDVILTTDDDYVSNQTNLISLQNAHGIRVVRIRNLDNGDLDLDHLSTLLIQHKPKLVSISHVPTNSGLIQDAKAVGELCQYLGALFLLDACQSVGQLQVDVNELKCDFLTVTGRKFLRGPRGTGILYVSDHALEMGLFPLYVDLRGATWTKPDEYILEKSARRFEFWECPYALIVGLKEAIKYANEIGLEVIETYNKELISYLRTNLQDIPRVKLLDKGTNLCNILTLVKDGLTQSQTNKFLKQNNVYHSISRKDNALIDFTKKGHDWAVRLSPHYFNTREEMDQITSIIKDM